MADKFINVVNKLRFKAIKHSPEILVVTGVAGMIGAAVTACRASTKLGKVVEEHRIEMDVVNQMAQGADEENSYYSEKDASRDRLLIFAKTSVKIMKLYAPSIVIGGASIACILASHNILRNRQAAAAAAYAAVDKGFKEYRERVVERFGEQVDKELKYAVKAQQVEEETVDESSGKTKKRKTVINAADPELGGSPYAMWFDKTTSSAYVDGGDYNRFFLDAQQAAATLKLKAVGWLSLSEVLDSIGVRKTKMSQIVGWSIGHGDDFVDFGYEVIPVRNEYGEYEDKIKLDFNVAGNILDYIPEMS